jgi:hypothetical protein
LFSISNRKKSGETVVTKYAFPYLNPVQSRTRPPSDWEVSLADVIENAFGKGHYELDALVAALNNSRVKPLKGGEWTAENFSSLMQELGA